MPKSSRTSILGHGSCMFSPPRPALPLFVATDPVRAVRQTGRGVLRIQHMNVFSLQFQVTIA